MEDKCVFCFEELSKRPVKQLASCGHIFHADCLADYVKHIEADPTMKCPICRKVFEKSNIQDKKSNITNKQISIIGSYINKYINTTKPPTENDVFNYISGFSTLTGRMNRNTLRKIVKNRFSEKKKGGQRRKTRRYKHNK